MAGFLLYYKVFYFILVRPCQTSFHKILRILVQEAAPTIQSSPSMPAPVTCTVIASEQAAASTPPEQPSEASLLR
jgi:hypothetical protein